MSEREYTRLSVLMNQRTAAELQYLSTLQGVSKTEVIRRAVAVLKFLEEEQAEGRRIYTMTRREKDWREVVFR